MDKECREWLQQRVLHSTNRLHALGKWLVAISTHGEHAEPPKQGGTSSFTKKSSTSSAAFSSLSSNSISQKRKRLHILYLLDDLIAHAHDRQPMLLQHLEDSLLQLTTLAGTFNHAAYPKHHRKLVALWSAWDSKSIPEQLMLRIRHAHAAAAAESTPKDAVADLPTIEAPWIMPPKHGVDTLPWCDQPAGAFLNALTPGDQTPIDGCDVVPVSLTSGSADEETVNAVRNLIKAVEDDYSGIDFDLTKVVEFDEIGQPLFMDPDTGEKRGRGDYYGWSEEYAAYARAVRKEAADVVSEDAPAWLQSHRPPPPKRPEIEKGVKDYSRSFGNGMQHGRAHGDGLPPPPPPPQRWTGAHDLPPPPPAPPAGPRGFHNMQRGAQGRGPW